MLNLIKYELRGQFVTILGISLSVIMANLFLMKKIALIEMLAPTLSSFVGTAAMAVMFLASLKLMSNYLYDEQGYLLFTLPQSGMSIMVSRLIVAVIQISIVAIISLLMSCVVNQDKTLNGILINPNARELLYSTLMSIWQIVFPLSGIYFCMIAGKIAFKGRKIGKIGSIIIFFVLYMGRDELTYRISLVFPQVVKLNAVEIISMNIGSTIFDIIAFAILLLATSYLLENKVDL
jgi:ABC-2 type transport system permease protein